MGTLEFAGVEFRYPTRPDTAALHDFSLAIRPRETVAIVVSSGARKSTLFQLAAPFYDPPAGAIPHDGVPLAAAHPAAIRARVAMLPHETISLDRKNVGYGKRVSISVYTG